MSSVLRGRTDSNCHTLHCRPDGCSVEQLLGVRVVGGAGGVGGGGCLINIQVIQTDSKCYPVDQVTSVDQWVGRSLDVRGGVGGQLH